MPKPHTQFSQPTRKLRKCHIRKLYARRRAALWTPPVPSRRIDDWQIDGMDSIFPGFGAWYRVNYDEMGWFLPGSRIAGLRG